MHMDSKTIVTTCSGCCLYMEDNIQQRMVFSTLSLCGQTLSLRCMCENLLLTTLLYFPTSKLQLYFPWGLVFMISINAILVVFTLWPQLWPYWLWLYLWNDIPWIIWSHLTFSPPRMIQPYLIFTLCYYHYRHKRRLVSKWCVPCIRWLANSHQCLVICEACINILCILSTLPLSIVDCKTHNT